MAAKSENREMAKNALPYTRWAAAFDLSFRFRYVLRDQATYESLLTGGAKKANTYSDKYWMTLGVDFWRSARKTKEDRKRIFEDFYAWKAAQEKSDPVRGPVTRDDESSLIEELLSSGDFWAERARRGATSRVRGRGSLFLKPALLGTSAAMSHEPEDSRQQRAELWAQKVGNPQAFRLWAFTYDLPFYLRLALRNHENYFEATAPTPQCDIKGSLPFVLEDDALSGFWRHFEATAPTPQCGVKGGLPFVLEDDALSGFWRGDLAALNCPAPSVLHDVYAEWARSGRPVRDQDDDRELWARIEEHMDLRPKEFWEARVEWGDNVEGFLDMYDGGRHIK